jgi:hypothetical protein
MIQNGTKVRWNWGKGTATGKVVETYSSDVTKTIKGYNVIQLADANNKAYYIEQENGDHVLKGENEIEEIDH